MKWYRFYRRYHSCLFRPVGMVILFAGLMIILFRQDKKKSEQLNELRTMQSAIPLDSGNSHIIPGILLILTGAALTYRKKTRRYWIG